jgi:cell division protein FtsB
MPESDLEQLRAENAELRRRVHAAEARIDELHAEAVRRRAEVRALAERLPAAMSRRALVRSLFRSLRRTR